MKASNFIFYGLIIFIIGSLCYHYFKYDGLYWWTNTLNPNLFKQTLSEEEAQKRFCTATNRYFTFKRATKNRVSGYVYEKIDPTFTDSKYIFYDYTGNEICSNRQDCREIIGQTSDFQLKKLCSTLNEELIY